MDLGGEGRDLRLMVGAESGGLGVEGGVFRG